MKNILINTASAYSVNISTGILKNAGGIIKDSSKRKYHKIAVITDSNVDGLYGDDTVASIKTSGYDVYRYVFKAGESAKSLNNVSHIISWLISNQFTRSDLLVALGGGVCGDLVGFVASVYLRGIDFVQIPTTLLAAVDSSVGGKTGINIPEGKNLVGSFWQPIAVICDTATLSTLKEEDYISGIAEIIKYGCIWDKKLFAKLENSVKVRDNIADIIARCVQIKAEIVSQDEHENGIRAILNWGHTIGHSVEKLSGYSIPHGYGVAIGMCVLAKSGEAIGSTEAGTYARLKALLDLYGLPASTDYGYEELTNACLGDKKRSGSRIKLILLDRIGSCEIVATPIDQLEGIIREGL